MLMRRKKTVPEASVSFSCFRTGVRVSHVGWHQGFDAPRCAATAVLQTGTQAPPGPERGELH